MPNSQYGFVKANIPKNIGESEAYHILELEHFTTKKNYREKMSKGDRTLLMLAMTRFPNGKHTPVGFNAS